MDFRHVKFNGTVYDLAVNKSRKDLAQEVSESLETLKHLHTAFMNKRSTQGEEPMKFFQRTQDIVKDHAREAFELNDAISSIRTSLDAFVEGPISNHRSALIHLMSVQVRYNTTRDRDYDVPVDKQAVASIKAQSERARESDDRLDRAAEGDKAAIRKSVQDALNEVDRYARSAVKLKSRLDAALNHPGASHKLLLNCVQQKRPTAMNKLIDTYYYLGNTCKEFNDLLADVHIWGLEAAIDFNNNRNKNYGYASLWMAVLGALAGGSLSFSSVAVLSAVQLKHLVAGSGYVVSPGDNGSQVVTPTSTVNTTYFEQIANYFSIGSNAASYLQSVLGSGFNLFAYWRTFTAGDDASKRAMLSSLRTDCKSRIDSLVNMGRMSVYQDKLKEIEHRFPEEFLSIKYLLFDYKP